MDIITFLNSIFHFFVSRWYMITNIHGTAYNAWHFSSLFHGVIAIAEILLFFYACRLLFGFLSLGKIIFTCLAGIGTLVTRLFSRPAASSLSSKDLLALKTLLSQTDNPVNSSSYRKRY